MDINKINFIKKSFITFDENTEKIMIYRENGDPNFHFVFDCPKCKKHNDFGGELKLDKVKIEKKMKEVYIFNCKNCGNQYFVERLKPPRGKIK
ncbi:MAG: hypothetical protein BJBARM5_0673 [Candidatus Parvarchaeum acidophilus ARMAN-5]|jgi:transcription elongation factor Elf1|uniref:Uncharacterized protein n=1 Tax=Candidatus Parvarchaeum acidophilus ARMAN-5 TaxID=662762 RepID=D6GW02_PARA5|nr:MAG: hypothetical protein BJBARM5_0673 [Candidatus Parvarchaeum acidophilus ARMAN-5]